MREIILLEMNIVLVDTNIVSFFLKKDSRAQAYQAHLQDKMLAISASRQSIGESVS